MILLMSIRELTPEELTFQSFRHSQGNGDLQSQMLQYVGSTHNVRPSFELDSQAIDRYLGFICARNSKAHARFQWDPELIMDEFERASDGYRTEPVPSLADLSKSLLEVETDRFKALLSFDSHPSRLTRALHRVESGQHSFLFHFGRDGMTTGFEAFNSMYSEVWSFVAENIPELQDLMESHSDSLEGSKALLYDLRAQLEEQADCLKTTSS
jgi:uncharacterized protein with HEPN domain